MNDRTQKILMMGLHNNKESSWVGPGFLPSSLYIYHFSYSEGHMKNKLITSEDNKKLGGFRYLGGV